MSIRHATVILAAVLSMLGTESAHAQQRPSAAEVDAEKRNEWVAAGLELVPMLGHAYAGDWKRGIWPTALRTVGGAGMMYALAQDPWFGGEGCYSTCTWMGVGGTLAALSGWVWGMVSAHRTAKDRNLALRENLGIQTSFAIRPAAGRFEVVAALRW